MILSAVHRLHSRDQFMRKRQKGVTLLELLTVVLILGILASIAVPSYRRYLLRAQRSDATTTLLRVQASQEKHFLQYGVYVTSTANMPNAQTAGGLGIAATTERGFYAITLTNTATGYTATATPIVGKGQSEDTQCATFAITEAGTKSASDSASTDSTVQCFR